MKRGLSSYIRELDFRDELQDILNGNAQKSDVAEFIAKQMGLFLEILVPPFTQVHYYGALVRPIVKKFNKKFKWAFSTQVMGEKFSELINMCFETFILKLTIFKLFSLYFFSEAYSLTLINYSLKLIIIFIFTPPQI